METKTLESKNEKAIQVVKENEDENSRGFSPAFDHQDHHAYYNHQSFLGGSPTSSVHRGYSLLN